MRSTQIKVKIMVGEMQMNVEDLLRLKIRLLTEGATIPEGYSSGDRGGVVRQREKNS